VIEIPGYYLKRTIGTGGMATVYLAVQESLDREVALKVMTPVLSADETFAARFRREARTIGKLSHPNIVQIYDVGTTADNHNYFSMQYLPGGTLKDRLNQPMEEMEVLRIFTGVLKALGFAHELGFVHRDVKPENILFDVAGTPILTDFGIARALRSSTRITQTGMSVGTSRYMSPEQARGTTVDARSDLYAMGVVLYEALTGSPPFESEDTFAVAYAHVNEPVPSLPASARDWEPVVHRAMAKDPRERFPTADAFIAALEDMARGRSRSAGVTGLTRIFSRNGRPKRRWWQFWRRTPAETPTDQVRTPLAIPSPSSRLLLARLRPWLPSFMRRPVWRIVQVVDETITGLARRHRHRRRSPRRPAVFLGGGLVLIALAVFGWYATRPMPGNTGGEDTSAGVAEPTAARTEAAGEQPDPLDADRPEENTQEAARPSNAAGTPENGITNGDRPIAEAGGSAGEDAVGDNDATGSRELLESVVPEPREEQGGSIESQLNDAREALEANRLTTPAGDNALELYERVLNREPDNERARQGLRRIVRRYLGLSRNALGENAPDRSAVYLMRATQVAGAHDINGELREALQSGRQATFAGLMERGETLRAQGDREAARELWSMAGRLQPGSEEVDQALEALEADEAADLAGERFRDSMASGASAPEMVRIPQGQFELGNSDFGKVEVSIDRPFAMSRREITVADFRAFVEASDYQGADHGCEVYENEWQYYDEFNWQSPGFPQQDEHPVVCISWNDAQAYVAWLSVQTGEGYRLPTEVEWEYALETGTAMEGEVCSVGNIGDRWLKGRFPREEAFDCADGSYFTAPVGSWPPNDYGLFDMVGNVREWTLDCWNRRHRNRPEGQEAWLSGSCGKRVIKGSSWLTGKPGMSPGHRLGEPVDAAYNAVGFRVVRELDTERGTSRE
jgi:formylglycine-generating enzyme required for sulfatase activity